MPAVGRPGISPYFNRSRKLGRNLELGGIAKLEGLDGHPDANGARIQGHNSDNFASAVNRYGSVPGRFDRQPKRTLNFSPYLEVGLGCKEKASLADVQGLGL